MFGQHELAGATVDGPDLFELVLESCEQSRTDNLPDVEVAVFAEESTLLRSHHGSASAFTIPSSRLMGDISHSRVQPEISGGVVGDL